jgi:hypothetical protein
MGEAPITLFLAGDVMTGRGVDQILTPPSAPELHEPFVTDAREYVRLAEQVSGPVPRGVAPDYIWGDALAEWERMAPAARIVNLETSVTRSDEYEHKGINYRMHPDNLGCLLAAQLDICILANNHVLDYGSGDSSRRYRRWSEWAFEPPAPVVTASRRRDLSCMRCREVNISPSARAPTRAVAYRSTGRRSLKSQA